MTGLVDGRRARGQVRRRALVDAAIAVLGRDGLSGLTHRAVAEEAGVSLASVSYHFSGLTDLVATAMRRVTDDLASTLASDPEDRSLARLAHLLATEVETRRDLILAEYETYLYSARNPKLGPEVFAWLDLLSDTFAEGLEGRSRAALQATIEGICLHLALARLPAVPAMIEDMLRLSWPADVAD